MKRLQVVQFLMVLALLAVFSVKDCCQKIPVEDDSSVEIFDLTPYLEGREQEFQERFSRPLFFTETSGNGDLHPRQMCTVESFSQLNREIQVVIVFLDQFTNMTTDRTLDELVKQNKNVHLATLDSKRAFATSELFGDIFSEVAKSRYHMEHFSDFLRLLLVWKFGGMFMDLDVIHFKSLKPFFDQNVNFVTPVAPYAMNINFFGFSRGHPVMLKFMEALRKRYNASEYVSAPRTIDTVLSKMANKSIKRIIKKGKIGDLTIPRYTLISPVHSSDSRLLFNGRPTMKDFIALTKKSYAVHFWNHQTHTLNIRPKSIFFKMAEKFCPKSFKSRYKKFV